MDTNAFRGGIPALMTPCNKDRSPDFDSLVEKAKELANREMSDEFQRNWYLQSKSKGVLDSLQEKIVSRKLLVFLIYFPNLFFFLI